MDILSTTQKEGYALFLTANVPYITIDNIVKQHYWLSDDEQYHWQQFEVAPPFPSYVMEYTLPKIVRSVSNGITPMPRSAKGVICRVWFDVLETLPPRQAFTPYTYDLLLQGWRNCRWAMSASLFLVDAKGKPGVFIQWIYLLDNDGFLMSFDNDRFYFFSLTPDVEAQQILVTYLNACGMAHNFIHTVNTELSFYGLYEPRNPPASLGKARRSVGNAEWKYEHHKISISPLSYRRGSSTDSGAPKALHTRRGHFKHYGPKYGRGLLFGKYEGRFYYEPVEAGDVAHGLITSDYEVNYAD